MRPQRLVSAWVSPGEPEHAGGGTLLQRSAAVPGSTKVGARSRLGRARAAKRTRSMDADYEGCQAGGGGACRAETLGICWENLLKPPGRCALGRAWGKKF